jgi:hypothetical protein
MGGCRGKHAEVFPQWGRWVHRLVRLTIVVIHYSDTSIFVFPTFFTDA